MRSTPKSGRKTMNGCAPPDLFNYIDRVADALGVGRDQQLAAAERPPAGRGI
jgi:hypothetical protein